VQPEQCAGMADAAEGGAHIQVQQVHVQPAGCNQGTPAALAGGAKIRRASINYPGDAQGYSAV